MHAGWWIFKKKKSGILYVGWRDKDGKTRSRTTGTKDRAIAKQRGTDWERERYAAEADLPAYSLAAALADLKAHKKRSKRSAATLSFTDCKCGHLLRVLGENFDVTKTTIDTSNAYLDKRRAEGAADLTIEYELRQLRQALRLGWRAPVPWFKRDPATIWPREALEGAYVPQEDYWTLEQYEAAQYHGIESRLDHVAMYCNTGVRHAELFRPTAAEIDLPHRRLWVPGTKTKGARRFVPLNDTAVEIVQRRAKLYPTGPLFPDRWSSGRIYHDMQRVGRRAGVPAATCNDWRRTFATWCGEAGVDEATVIKWMGHKSSTMVRLVYQKLSDKRAAIEERKLSAFVRGAPAAVTPAVTPRKTRNSREETAGQETW